jgi:glycosyltransferase 2 family protein
MGHADFYNGGMIERLRPWFPWLKAIFTVAVLAGVAVLFWRAINTEELHSADPSRPAWQVLRDEVAGVRPVDLAIAGVLYLLGLTCCAAFWMGLLRRLGGRLDLWPGVRAYTMSQLGKYVPGKGWPLLIRVTLAMQAGVRPGLAALSGAYEILTMMAAGAFLAAVLFAVLPGDPTHLWWALALFVLAVVPILPGVFNRLVRRLTRRFARGETLPSLGLGTLGAGLALTSCCWVLFGISLAAVLRAFEPDPGLVDPGLCLRCIAIVAVSYVAGFVASTPGGLGVREFLMQQFLAPALGPLRAIVAVILVRLLWTAAEVIAAGVLFWVPHRNRLACPTRAALVAPAPCVPDLVPSPMQPPP